MWDNTRSKTYLSLARIKVSPEKDIAHKSLNQYYPTPVNYRYPGFVDNKPNNNNRHNLESGIPFKERITL